jgi:hypothetical protein
MSAGYQGARDPLCVEALATNRLLRERIVELELRAAGGYRAELTRMEGERDAALAEADAARIYLWQRLPWRGYAS